MECLKEVLTPERFSVYGYIVAVIYFGCGILFSGGTGDLRATERRNFHCNVASNGGLDKDFIKATCFDQYDQQNNSPLPLWTFSMLSFSVPTIVCIVYSWCFVKSRVEEVQRACKFDPENPRPRRTSTTRRSIRVFICYVIQVVVRITLGIVFTILQNIVLYPSGFPSRFQCQLNSGKSKTIIDVNTTFANNNSSLIDCQSSIGSDKDAWLMWIWIINIIFVLLMTGEVIYLICKVLRDNTFIFDFEFCQTHLFNKKTNQLTANQRRRILEDTQELPPLIPPSPGNNQGYKNLDDIYVDLIIHAGESRYTLDKSKQYDRHELFREYIEPPKHSIRITKLEQLFLPNEDSEIGPSKICPLKICPRKTELHKTGPRKILIVGCPGIGKSSLCIKLMRDWSKGQIFQKSKFQCAFLFRFRTFNSEEMKSMSLQTLLSHAINADGKIDDDDFQFILNNPDKVLLVFDGLDEFKDHEKCREDEEKHAGNGVTEIMPTSALYVKLVKGKLLGGATVLTTTRPYAIDSVSGLKFDRAVEIMGFSPDKVEEYCTKFFQGNEDAMNMVWQHIQSNINLLYLCYIPVNCRIVCSLLEKIVSLSDCSSEGVTLPTTLTGIYKGALKMFILKHHPKYQGTTLKRKNLSFDVTFSNSVEETLSKLESLAVKGIDEKRLVFESEEVKGMENCGLLNRLQDVVDIDIKTAKVLYKSQYCFIHLTLQEFVAARNIVKMDLQELKEFISSKANDAKWHLVIQFVAGLIKDKDTVVIDSFVELLHRGLLSNNKHLSLLMMKCLYEFNDDSTVKKAAAELKSKSEFTNEIDLSSLSLNPVDCTAIVYFLKHFDTLQCLNLSRTELGKEVCSVLAKLLEEEGPQKLDLSGCKFPDHSLISLLDTIKIKKCRLSNLILNRCFFLADEEFSCLFNTLTDENCKLTELHLKKVRIRTPFKGLCIALKHRNCKLTSLTCSLPEDKDMCSNFCSALIDKNCKLTNLDICHMPGTRHQEYISGVCEALKHENCNVIKLRVNIPVIAKEYLSDDEKCKLTELSQITYIDMKTHKPKNCKPAELAHKHFFAFCQCLSYFFEALKNKNCKLTELELYIHIDLSSEVMKINMTDRSIRHNIDRERVVLLPITDKDISDLCAAITHENCKLTKLSLISHDPCAITNEGIQGLQNALTHQNCKLETLTICRNTNEPIPFFFPRCNDCAKFQDYESFKVTCSNSGHNILCKMGASGQYEEISLLTYQYLEPKKYIRLHIER